MGSYSNAVVNENVFYKQLVVLSSLHSLDRKQYHRIKRPIVPNQFSLSPSGHLTDIASRDLRDDHKLQVFLNYLAEVCASTRSGRTVTAVTVHLPKESDRPQYLFVSNFRFPRELNPSRRYVEGILKTFGDFQNDPGFPQNWEVPPEIRDSVLENFLEFNQERFKEYVKIIFRCLDKLSRRSNLNRKSRDVLKILEVVIPREYIQGIRDACDDPRSNNFVSLALIFMQKLESERRLQEGGIFSSLDTLLEHRTQVDKSHYLALWHEFQHALKRMLSLYDAFGVFEATAREWPQLFRGVTVEFLRSKNSKAYRLEKIDHFKAFFQSLNLGYRVTQQATSKYGLGREVNYLIQGVDGTANRRSVHAELQLWAYTRNISSSQGTFVPFRPGSSNENDGAAKPAVVIGVSKLTCRLCHWFFQSIDSDRVVIRPSSWNVYHRWALPRLPQDPQVTVMLHDELFNELSRVLVGGEIQRTETDTDSAPNSASLYIHSHEPSYASTDLSNSEFWSHEEQSTSSVESDTDSGKSGKWQSGYEQD